MDPLWPVFLYVSIKRSEFRRWQTRSTCTSNDCHEIELLLQWPLAAGPPSLRYGKKAIGYLLSHSH